MGDTAGGSASDTAGEGGRATFAVSGRPTALLDAAARIGRMLCHTAYWHDGRCNWVGRSPREMAEPGAPIVPTVSALGPEFYGGTAGIALFLAQLHATTGSRQASRAAQGAIRQSLAEADQLPPNAAASFHSGAVGIAYAAARVALLLDAPPLLDDALALARRAAAAADGHQPLDVIGGNAGAAAPLLWLAGLCPGGEPLETFAMGLAADLAAAAVTRDGAWCWDAERASGKGIGTTPLCGLAHGASGMGLALIEAGTHGGRGDWVAGGLAAFTYEDRLYDAERQNWPDLREYASRAVAPNVLVPNADAHSTSAPNAGASNASVPGAPPRAFMVAWCHGAAGIGLARLRAYALLPDRREELRPGIDRAIRATTHALCALPRDGDASPCHGRAGLAELLTSATATLGDPHHHALAAATWARAARSHSAADWPCGVASGRNNPSLMLGHAGVGYALLRTSDPATVPSALLVPRSAT